MAQRSMGPGMSMRAQAKSRLETAVSSHSPEATMGQRLTTPLGTTGAMSLYQAGLNDHLALAKHLTAEQKVEEFVAGKGVVVKWERLRRQNHWFDALYNASATASFCGVRLVEQPPEPPAPKRANYHGFDRPDGRPWFDTEEWQERMGRYF